MKKILFMVSSMNIGGVEKSLLSLLSEIPKDKYDITLLLLEKKGEFLEQIPDWVKVEEASWFKEIKPIIMQSPQQTIKNYMKSNKYFKVLSFIVCYMIDKYFDNRYLYYKNVFKDIPFNENEYDAAIAYQGPTDTIDYYITHKVRAEKKISWVHFDISKHYINKKLYSKLYQKFNKIYVVSNEAKKKIDEIIPISKIKTETFFNIISSKVINNMKHETVNFDDTFEGINIATVGRLSYEKGQDLAIEIMYRLKQDGYLFKWYFVGDGLSRKKYEEMIYKYGLEKECILVGATSNPYPYIDKSDIYVQTSRHEGYCLTLAEARCLHKPIVSTNFIGAYEQITNNEDGYITDCNVDELYKKIKYLIDNKDTREKFIFNLSRERVDTIKEISKLTSYIDGGDVYESKNKYNSACI